MKLYIISAKVSFELDLSFEAESIKEVKDMVTEHLTDELSDSFEASDIKIEVTKVRNNCDDCADKTCDTCEYRD